MQERVERLLRSAAWSLLILLAYGGLLGLALLLSRVLVGTMPSAGQLLVFFVIGAVAGYVAEQVVRGMRPLGYAGSILAGMMGAWIASNLLPRPPRWDYPISTSAGNVPTLTAFGAALLLAFGWRLVSGSSSLRRAGILLRERFSGAGRPLGGSIANGWFAGFLVGCTLGWGGGLIWLLARRPGGTGILTLLCVAALVLGGCLGWRAFFLQNGRRFFGRPLDGWWARALVGLLSGIAGLALMAVGLEGIV
ncbi:MAG: GlsB/YeaQ/YmgE family stress response membrane protein [Chloroflexia bacterium]